jgi:hypothetical protein
VAHKEVRHNPNAHGCAGVARAHGSA